jgi:hypothetical protein
MIHHRLLTIYQRKGEATWSKDQYWRSKVMLRIATELPRKAMRWISIEWPILAKELHRASADEWCEVVPWNREEKSCEAIAWISIEMRGTLLPRRSGAWPSVVTRPPVLN